LPEDVIGNAIMPIGERVGLTVGLFGVVSVAIAVLLSQVDAPSGVLTPLVVLGVLGTISGLILFAVCKVTESN